MPDKEDVEIQKFLVIVMKKLKKHGIRKFSRNIQMMDTEGNGVFQEEVLDFTFDAVCEEFCIERETLLNKKVRGLVGNARTIFIVVAREHLDKKEVSNESIANRLHRVRQVVYHAQREFETYDRESKFDARFFERYDSINKKVTEYIKVLKGNKS